MDHFEVIGNGEVVATLPLDEGGTSGHARQKIAIARSGWYLLRAWNSKASHPVRDYLPFATTSPIYVTVADRPVRSAANADMLAASLDCVHCGLCLQACPTYRATGREISSPRN